MDAQSLWTLRRFEPEFTPVPPPVQVSHRSADGRVHGNQRGVATRHKTTQQSSLCIIQLNQTMKVNTLASSRYGPERPEWSSTRQTRSDALSLQWFCWTWEENVFLKMTMSWNLLHSYQVLALNDRRKYIDIYVCGRKNGGNEKVNKIQKRSIW